ncbi:HET domain protein [Metarhizium brunneum]
MATSWPQEVAWPAGFREHATQLGKYLSNALLCIERAKDQHVPHNLIKIITMSALSLVNKIHNVPDFSSVRDALQMARTESKSAVASAMQALDDIKKELKQAANTGQQTLEGIRKSHEVQNETKVGASESTDIGRTVLTMMREMKNADQHKRPSPIRTYAFIAAGNGLDAMYIRNPLTISSLRAMNPRSLKAHVDRAIEQSGNEHIVNTKTLMRLDTKYIGAGLDANQRMIRMWEKMAEAKGGIPARLIFYIDESIDIDGWRWAPKSLLASAVHDPVLGIDDRIVRFHVDKNSTRPADVVLGTPTSLGLKIVLPGCRIVPTPLLPEFPLHAWPEVINPIEDKIVVQDEQTGRWFRIFDWYRSIKLRAWTDEERVEFDKRENGPLCRAIHTGKCALIMNQKVAMDDDVEAACLV